MSLDTIDKITRTANELEGWLSGVSVPFERAVNIHYGLKFLPKAVADLKAEIVADKNALLEIIEGLLANWPTTDAISHYEPKNRPVLMKDEALKRAADAPKNGS